MQIYSLCVCVCSQADQETEGILIQKLDFTNNSKIIDYLMEVNVIKVMMVMAVMIMIKCR